MNERKKLKKQLGNKYIFKKKEVGKEKKEIKR